MLDRDFAKLTALAVLAMLFIAGCGPRADRYTPSPESARTSLDAALAAWQDGRGLASDRSPLVQFVDTSRTATDKLRSYEVLSETSVTGKGRAFVVRLKLDNPARELRARYVVVGIDPIWVFRKEDYDRLAHWEHPMDEASAEKDALISDPAPAATTGASQDERL